MSDETIKIDMPSIGVMGSKTTIKNKNGDVVETRTGTFASKYIDSFYIVIEDELAKQVIEIIACDCDNLPRKYIFSGVWGNQAACLFGFLLYADKLKGSNVPPFSIIAIDDGDIAPNSKEKRLNGLLKGNFFGEELKRLRENLSRLLLSFKLEYLDEEVKKGLPEYNHKKWFEEITKEMVFSKEQPSNLYEERQLESLLEIIEFSKSLQLEDYHDYYKELSRCTPRNTINDFHRVEYFVLNSIRKYNSIKWELYTSHIRLALMSLDKENRNNFVAADMYFQR
ncbi:hypothetical protein G6Z90_15710 [Vibrio aestuarianus subsp. cardii]|uniref:hypothetical protein n=1 Tax=Vibrio aestuarianus TaxID=28171 RepID=UPI001593F98E|nr:hypothetical protein [Vibrio aestuarianus]MDE1312613.1 hypothetical protein [Vibrio aestuarianus]NGZ93920.1 hypothetical protein [Vibrio aestuarianus subsp. cardii]